MATHAYRVITHIHSHSSNSEASPGYPLISQFLLREFGPAAERVRWSECETSVADLESIINGRRTRGPVDLLFLTDHMSSRRHLIDEATVELARRCHRFAIGAELQTCLRTHGRWLSAPEVLLYGTATPHENGSGRHYGLTQSLIDEAYASCTCPGAPEPDILSLREFCERRQIACALAHPLDGHQLPLPALLDVIGRFDFIETVNGGFSEANGRLLGHLLTVLRRRERAVPGELAAIGQGDVRRAPALVALGGSDAHLEDFDRVVTLFASDVPPDAGTFVAAMLGAGADPVRARSVFAPSGRGIRAPTLAWEVLRLILRNFGRNRQYLADRRRVGGALLRGLSVARREMQAKYRHAGGRRRQLAAWLKELDSSPRHVRPPIPH